MKNKLLFILKWGWIAVVILFLVFFIYKNKAELKQAAGQIDLFYLAISFVFIFAAKIILPIFMKFVVDSLGRHLGFGKCFRIYNISQLGKYLPGNIWHFVGKAAAYKLNGFNLPEIRDALIIENLWLVISAFTYGTLLVLFFDFNLIQTLFSAYKFAFISLLIILLLTGFFAQKMFKASWLESLYKYPYNINILISLFFIWSFFGSGFAVLIVPFLSENASIFMVTGLYAIAFSIGFITPFAPAGIGVREAILVLGLFSYVTPEIVLLASAANRMLYLIVELILAVVAQFFTVELNHR